VAKLYAWYRSPTDVSKAKVVADTIATIQKLQTVNNFTRTTPNVIEYRSHTPYKLYVSPKAIEAGFHAKLDALQGHRRTYYTGSSGTTRRHMSSPRFWRPSR
jgi:hypothetical protein